MLDFDLCIFLFVLFVFRCYSSIVDHVTRM